MWLSQEELSKIGFSQLGRNVLIDHTAVFVRPEKIAIGNNSRIDGQVFISAGPEAVFIGEHAHVGHGSKLFGTGGITLGFGAGISSNCSLFSESDDYSSGHLANPTMPDDLRNVRAKKIEIGDFALIGSNSVVLPGVNVGRGSSCGALTLVHRNIPSGVVVSGNPMRKIGIRNLEKLNRLAEDQRLYRDASVDNE